MLFRVPGEHAARLGGLPGVQANLALRVCNRCATRPLEELSHILKARVTAQVDAIITEASWNNALPERCGYCGGPADMAHVQGHRYGCDVLFGSANRAGRRLPMRKGGGAMNEQNLPPKKTKLNDSSPC